MDFLGQSVQYWMELDRRVRDQPDSLNARALLREVVELRGLVDFYENRVGEMAQMRRTETR